MLNFDGYAHCPRAFRPPRGQAADVNREAVEEQHDAGQYVWVVLRQNVEGDTSSALDHVERQPAERGLFIARSHVEPGLIHGANDLIERNFVFGR